jgi:hypothetical protein
MIAKPRSPLPPGSCLPIAAQEEINPHQPFVARQTHDRGGAIFDGVDKGDDGSERETNEMSP